MILDRIRNSNIKFSVRAKPNMKEEKIEKVGDVFNIYVKELAKEGKANKAVIELVSEYFNVTKSKIVILSGVKSRYKTIEILF
ncbi:MAG: DUF167 domain-containing protein [Thermodesulfovibrionales bacterium]